jgi:hypothetical protein
MLYSSPAIVIFVVFSYAIELSLYRTNPQSEMVPWFGFGHFARILALDGSGRTEFVQSIGAGLVISVALGVLASVKSGALLVETNFANSRKGEYSNIHLALTRYK